MPKPALSLRSILLLSGISFIFHFQVLSQNASSDVKAVVQQLHERGQFNGCLWVMDRGNVVFMGGMGYANKEKKIAFTPQTPTYLASLTKQFTAMAVMMLKEEKRLNYDDRLRNYFPELPSCMDSVTLRHLLNHTSGIPDYFHMGISHAGLTNHEVFEALKGLKALEFSPGSQFRYSNTGYILLAMVVEHVSGMKYSKFLAQRIFNPLHMNHSLVIDSFIQRPLDRAIGYNRFGGIIDYDLLTQGDGGIYSTVEDLAKWLHALSTKTLVSPATLQEAFQPTRLTNGQESLYGFGWGLIKQDDHSMLLSHSGVYQGFSNLIQRDLKDSFAFIMLTNHEDTRRSDVLNAVVAAMQGKPVVLPPVSIANALYRIIHQNGIKQAVAYYEKVKKDSASKYDFSEQELNFLGYQLLSEKRKQEAVEVFNLNIEAYPTSSNAYESLGEAYMQQKNASLARKAFDKSLQLDPHNQDAIKMLGTLGNQGK